jgi:hypothetical protein
MKTAVGIAKTAGVVTISSIIIFGTIFGAMFYTMPPIEAFINTDTYNPTQDAGQAM